MFDCLCVVAAHDEFCVLCVDLVPVAAVFDHFDHFRHVYRASLVGKLSFVEKRPGDSGVRLSRVLLVVFFGAVARCDVVDGSWQEFLNCCEALPAFELKPPLVVVPFGLRADFFLAREVNEVTGAVRSVRGPDVL